MLENIGVAPEEYEMYRDATSFDDIMGSDLNKKEAVKARRMEIQLFCDRGIYTKVRRKAHINTISTKWFDVNKGHADNIDIRARLVSCEFARDKRYDLLAATPTLESITMILSGCASNGSSQNRCETIIIM